ncbi:MAG: pseudouridine synthase [Campylobacterota bacterium]|nr:pseudouridine synthase [Campylobacterota bacterium]
MRLNKYIAHYSTYSRREADRAILDGYVKVDDEEQTNPATQVDEKWSVVVISGKKIIPNDNYTVIAFNKPKGCLVTKNDPQGRKIVYDFLDAKYKHFIPVGRLDFASEGLLLFTDSSRVAEMMMTSSLERMYKIKIRGPVSEAMEDGMRHGLALQDATAGGHELSKIDSMDFAPFYAYQVLKSSPNYSTLKVVIGEGKNREIRRFFAHYDAEVTDLKRLSFGGIELNNLPTAKTRFLNRGEYNSLHRFMKQRKDSSKSDRTKEYIPKEELKKEPYKGLAMDGKPKKSTPGNGTRKKRK